MPRTWNSTGIAGPWVWIAVPAIAIYGTLLYLNDPEQGGFPSCPLRAITGLLCPGCGSQRALHHLMHGHLAEAFDRNALFVLAVPTLVAQWAWGRFFNGGRSATSYNAVVLGWALVVVGWGILRNT